MNSRYSTYHTLSRYHTWYVCKIDVLVHPASSDERFVFRTGANVLTLSLFRVLFRQRRQYQPSSRQLCRHFPGAVAVGGHSGGRIKRKGPPRVEQRIAERGER